MKVSATKDGKTVTVEYDFGGNLDEAVKKFGQGPVWAAALQQMKVRLQAIIRQQIEAGAPPDAIQKHVAAWKPGQGPQRKSPVEKLAAKLAGLPEEERRKVLEELRGMITK